MPEVTITISVPEGTTINIAGVESALDPATVPWQIEPPDWVGRYWQQYLSNNGRKVFGQAARHERRYGPGYTLEELAHELSIDYESIKSYHRSAGRSAKRWRNETGMPEPIRLEVLDYGWDETA